MQVTLDSARVAALQRFLLLYEINTPLEQLPEHKLNLIVNQLVQAGLREANRQREVKHG